MTEAEQPTHRGETESRHPGSLGPDADPVETAEWLESLAFVLERKGPERAAYLLALLEERAHLASVELPFAANTPYINTINTEQQPA